MKHHDFVDAVEQFGPHEPALHLHRGLAHHVAHARGQPRGLAKLLRDHRRGPALEHLADRRFDLPILRAARREFLNLCAAVVAGHHDDHIAEVDRAALAIGQTTIVKHLQQDVEHVRVRLLDFIKQHHAVGPPPHRFGQLPALVVSDVTRRRANQPRHGVLLAILAHVDANHRLFGVKQKLGERLARLGLAHARGPKKQEAANGLVGVRKPRAGASHRVADGLQRVRLTNHAPGKLVFHARQLVALALDQSRDRNARPACHNFRNRLCIDLFLYQRVTLALAQDHRGLRALELGFQLAHLAIANASRHFKLPGTLGFLQLHLLGRHLLLDVLDAVKFLLLRFPAAGQRTVLLLQFRKLTLDALEFASRAVRASPTASLARSLARFDLERLALNLQLHDPPAELIQLRRHAVDLDAQPRRGFVHQIDGLVGQESIRDIPVAQLCRREDRAVEDLHAVVGLIPRLEPAQDRHRLFNIGLIHENRLKSPLKRRVLLDMLAILVERRRADASQFAAGEGGLEQVARADRALRRTRADDRVQFVDKQDHLAIARLHFAQHGLETILKLAPELRAGEQLTHVQRHDPLVTHPLWAIAVHDPQREALGDRRLAHARLANQHRIVLGAPAQHLHRAPNLLVTPDHRIELALLGLLRQVNRVLLQRVVAAFGFRIADVGHAAALADLLDRGFERLRARSDRGKHVLAWPPHCRRAQQQVFAADVRVAEFLRLPVGVGEQLHERASRAACAAAGLRKARELLAHRLLQSQRFDSRALQDRPRIALAILEQAIKHVQRRHLRMPRAHCAGLGVRQGLLSGGSESIRTHAILPDGSRPPRGRRNGQDSALSDASSAPTPPRQASAIKYLQAK